MFTLWPRDSVLGNHLKNLNFNYRYMLPNSYGIKTLGKYFIGTFICQRPVKH